jgi:putative DNA primase/helicase
VVLEALRYAALGFRVVPLHRRSKSPILKRWPERATTDPDTIIKWFGISWPEANLTIVLGEGTFALDVDVRHRGRSSLKKLTRSRRLPETAQAITGSGGKHFLFKVGGGPRIATTIGLMPGIDIIGEGGLLVVEPSEHDTTHREYVWQTHPRLGIAKAPKWLLQRLARAAPPDEQRAVRPLRCVRGGAVPGLVARIIERFPVAGGDRHRQMTRAIGSLLGQQYEPGLVREVLLAWHAHFEGLGLTGTGEDKADKEIAACIRSTLKNPEFTVSASGSRHLARIAEIQLTSHQHDLIKRGTISDGEIRLPTPGGLPPPLYRYNTYTTALVPNRAGEGVRARPHHLHDLRTSRTS